MQTEHIHFDKIDSTNTWAKQNIDLFPQNALTVVSAGEQTAGHGRMKHQWLSPPSQNIYATFCFWVPLGFTYLNNISQLLAISCVEVLQTCGFAMHLKWPNDIVTPSKKKVAGILCETVIRGNQVCVLAGIGLNVNMPLELLETIDKPATSLFAESGRPFDIEALLKQLSDRFATDLVMFKKMGLNSIIEKYRGLILCKPGEKIYFHSGGVLVEGVFDSIADDGSLYLRMQNGELRNFLSGEILVHVHG